MSKRFEPEYVYHSQRRGAAYRGIDFLLTFGEWWNIWQQSGHWLERGCHKGQYCMSRFNDIGPYAVGNVFIQYHCQNCGDGARIRIKKPLPTVQCIHCGIILTRSNHTRWHGDNCKFKPTNSI